MVLVTESVRDVEWNVRGSRIHVTPLVLKRGRLAKSLTCDEIDIVYQNNINSDIKYVESLYFLLLKAKEKDIYR